MNREFLQLAHKLDSETHIGGWMWSQKLDGQRCLWDGGLTRGMPCSEIPFANTSKHERLLAPPVSTGLWSRYGQPIRAPEKFLDRLPRLILDGELYCGRGNFQDVESTVKKFNPVESEWDKIKFHVFDSPPVSSVFCDGKINNPNFKKEFYGIVPWVKHLATYDNLVRHFDNFIQFEFVYKVLEEIVETHHTVYGEQAVVELVRQERLPFAQELAIAKAEIELEREVGLGGEGLMIRKPEAFYLPKRVHDMLKMKRLEDSEGTIIGFVTGRRTDLGSKLRGKIGAVVLKWGNVVFELSGFTDAEREFATDEGRSWAWDNPETKTTEFQGKHFRIGDQVTFRYRELTRDGIPKEGRYWRKGS